MSNGNHSRERQAKAKGNVLVLVLGDVGRSPRMQYHALSLLQSDYAVYLSGYVGSPLIDDFSRQTRLHTIRFDPSLPFGNLSFFRKSRVLKPLYYVLRLLALLLLPLLVCLRGLASTFVSSSSPSRGFDYVLVQTPPAVPTLLLGGVVKLLSTLLTGKRCELIVDWHNIGYTMFDESEALLRKLTRLYEKALGPLVGDHHFCVSAGMKTWLASNFNVQATVLHDRPPHFFKPTSADEAHELFKRLSSDFVEADKFFKASTTAAAAAAAAADDDDESTLFTVKKKKGGSSCNSAEWRKVRPELIISSTSWTPDEDFSILLDALVLLDFAQTSADDDAAGANLLVVVTGKGPLKELYVDKMSKLKLKRIYVMTIWLAQSDYPLLLGCASLGVSLHTSTSGIDLPMKVCDMFGCGVPVAAVNFQCVGEIVGDGRNGRIFDDAEGLKNILVDLFGGGGGGELAKLRKGVESGVRWEENWRRIMGERLGERDAARRKAKEYFGRVLIMVMCVGVAFLVGRFAGGAAGSSLRTKIRS